MDRKKLFHTLAFLIVAIFVVNSLANKFYWYSSVWYMDIIMHIMGGFWVGLLTVYFFSPKTASVRLVIKTLIVVVLIGLGWELFEAFTDKVISLNTFNIMDTVSDIFFDLAGGTAALFYYVKKIMSASASRVQSN